MHLGEGIQAWEGVDNQSNAGRPSEEQGGAKEELGAWWVARTRPYWSRDKWMTENRRLQFVRGVRKERHGLLRGERAG